MADIDVGQLSEAINDKMDRDAHNVESPSAVVIESQMPTADNNYTWYRKYSDGWVEQGGKYQSTSNGYQTYNLIVSMADSNYTLVCSYQDVAASDSSVRGFNTGAFTTTTFKAKNGVNGSNVLFNWQVSGKYAI